MAALDYKNTEEGDLLFDGDLVLHDATNIHQQDILLAAKGHYRQFPDVGVDLGSWIEDDANGDLAFEIRREFEKDGMKVERLKVLENGEADIKAVYK